MTCPKCHNFLVPHIVGNRCSLICSSCSDSFVEPHLVIHASRKGNVPSHANVEDLDSLAASVSYDQTLLELPDKKCPRCGANARAWRGKDHIYILICPECHRVI